MNNIILINLLGCSKPSSFFKESFDLLSLFFDLDSLSVLIKFSIISISILELFLLLLTSDFRTDFLLFFFLFFLVREIDLFRIDFFWELLSIEKFKSLLLILESFSLDFFAEFFIYFCLWNPISNFKHFINSIKVIEVI